MTITTNIIRNVAGAAAVLVLLAGAADAQMRLKAVDPQPGQCKTTAETNFGGSPQQAQDGVGTRRDGQVRPELGPLARRPEQGGDAERLADELPGPGPAVLHLSGEVNRA
jgi:hypothetical protein